MHHNILSITSPVHDDRVATDPPADWDPPFGNLTGTLLSKAQFLNALLPCARPAVKALNNSIRRDTPVPVSGTTKALNLYSRVASAVDRGCLYLSGHDPVSPIIPWLKRNGTPGNRIATICELYSAPTRGVLRSRAAIGWFYLLGMLDPIRRRFRTFSDIDLTALPLRPRKLDVTHWLENLVPDDVALETADLLRAVRDARILGRFSPNPVFGGTGVVTGSDGDWIAGDTLVELKCVVRVKREHIAQLLCYYAFDQLMTHGHSPYGFTDLALRLPRQRCSIVGSVDEWLAAFGGPPKQELPRMIGRWCEPIWERKRARRQSVPVGGTADGTD